MGKNRTEHPIVVGKYEANSLIYAQLESQKENRAWEIFEKDNSQNFSKLDAEIKPQFPEAH